MKRRYFELIRQAMKGAAAARRVGVSTSCGSLRFFDADGVIISERGPNSAWFLDQDERIRRCRRTTRSCLGPADRRSRSSASFQTAAQ